jgi:predicted phage terminase large subunit-like protein
MNSVGVVAGKGEARRELARRELARRRLADYCAYVSPWFQRPRHLQYAVRKLEEVERYVRTRGEEGIGRLLIMMPPRHGKSELVSRHFPAWVLGRNPDVRVVLTSYGADLAVRNSRALRDQVSGMKFVNVFGERGTPPPAPTQMGTFGEGRIVVELSSDSRNVQAWDLAAPARGGVVATGVGGALTGMGANLLIVDDPVKNREEAESEEARRRVWEWWTSTAYTRLEEGGAVVGMLTRWHTDDWAGRLLAAAAHEAGADQWEVVCFPAIAEGISQDRQDEEDGQDKTWSEERGEGIHRIRQDEEDGQDKTFLMGKSDGGRDVLGRRAGEALWPEKYNVEDLERIKANVGAYDWEALYQQSPYSRSMGFFKREWFAVVEQGPKEEEVVERVRAWDKAGTATGKGGDYGVGVLLAMTSLGVVYVEHVERGQWRPMEREEAILRCAEIDRMRKGARTMIWHQQDPGSSGLDSAEATNRMLAGKGFEARFETVTGTKEVRAGPWSTMCQGGGVRLVRGGWNEAFVAEHEAFPRGRYDDQVDAASWGFVKLGMGMIEGKLMY